MNFFFMDNMILYLNANNVLSLGKCIKALYKLTMITMKDKHTLKVMLNGPKHKNEEYKYKFQYDDKAIESIMTSLWDNEFPFIFLSTYINIRKYFKSCENTLRHELEYVPNQNTNSSDDEESVECHFSDQYNGH